MAWEFGRYRMEELIARGGMGEVYRAYDTRHQRFVAIKLLAEHGKRDDEYRRRFEREARAAAGLREPHVIPIHDYGELEGRLYLDMRLVDGSDLGDVLAAHGPMDPATAVNVVAQVAAALDAAHAEGLVHRDVKPSNVLLTADGFAYLADFGIARSMASSADITGTGVPIGSVAYMAPERFAPGPVDHRVDVYSLACLLFQCLTGVAPFRGGNALALMHAHINQEPPRPAELRPDLSPAFDHVIATGMAKDPRRRFTSAGALAAAARSALAPPTPELPAILPDTRPAPPRSSGGRGWLIGGAVAVAVALAVAAALNWLPGLNDKRVGQQPTETTTPTVPETPDSDLSVSVPISKPACDGRYIVVVASAVNPDEYREDVQIFLNENPGARYLHAPSTGCGSLSHQHKGADIYAVYFGPFRGRETACEKRETEGGDSFVRRLDNTSTPGRGVSCD